MTDCPSNIMAITGQESGEVFYQNNRASYSPTRSKGRSPKTAQSPLAPRGKRTEYFETVEKTNRVRPGNQGYITPNRGSPQGKNRVSPSKDRSPRLSPSHLDYYAGFGDSPAPAALPIPPSHWMAPFRMSSGKMYSFLNGAQSQSLSCSFQDFKVLLKAQA